MSTREDLANALSTVVGITGNEYVVGTFTPGTAYPRLDRVEYPNPFGGVAHWNVIVVLPQGIAESEKYVEMNLPSLKEALEPHLVITAAQMGRLSIPNTGEVPALFINGHREADQ